MAPRTPRIAVRGVLVHDRRLLLVNAWADHRLDLWCAPGGGVEAHSSLPNNLAREIHEETGLTVTVGAPCLVNEFHDPERDFHQVEVFFRCTLVAGQIREDWQDPDGVVSKRRWVTEVDLAEMNVKPTSLGRVAFQRGFGYDPLEPLLG